MAQPARLDLNLYAGDGFAMALTFIDKETGAPWPADGEWSAQVRATPDASEVLAAFVVDATEASDGRITIGLTGDNTRAIAASCSAVWDLQQVNGAEPRTWYRGIVRVLADVTR